MPGRACITSRSPPPTSLRTAAGLRDAAARHCCRCRPTTTTTCRRAGHWTTPTLRHLQQHGLLYDRDEPGEFRHLYTDAFHDRFFFEAVQRQAGYAGFGAANASVRTAAQARQHPVARLPATDQETLAMIPQNEFIQRDRAQHPPALTPDYKTSVLRSPAPAIVVAAELAVGGHRPGVRAGRAGPARSRPDPELRQDRASRSANAPSCMAACSTRTAAASPNTLVEVWQANAGGRYRHKNDTYSRRSIPISAAAAA